MTYSERLGFPMSKEMDLASASMSSRLDSGYARM